MYTINALYIQCITEIKAELKKLDEFSWFKDLWNDENNPNGNKLRT